MASPVSQQKTIDFKVRKTRSSTLKKHLKKCSKNDELLPLSPSKRKLGFNNISNIENLPSPSKRVKENVPQSPLVSPRKKQTVTPSKSHICRSIFNGDSPSKNTRMEGRSPSKRKQEKDLALHPLNKYTVTPTNSEGICRSIFDENSARTTKTAKDENDNLLTQSKQGHKNCQKDDSLTFDGSPLRKSSRTPVKANVIRPILSENQPKIDSYSSTSVDETLKVQSPCKKSTARVNSPKKSLSRLRLTPVKQCKTPKQTASCQRLRSKDSPSVKLTPKALKLVKQDVQSYETAKKLLHTAVPERILCRETEVAVVNEFVHNQIEQKLPGSLYVSGAPGTGKTAIITKLIQDMKLSANKVRTIFINCMMLRNTQAIYSKVLSDIQGKEVSVPSIKLAMKQIEKLLSARGPMVLLILDEVDQLDSKSQEILYTMFEWPALPKSRLILIGIANALDLTDRILPRLQSKPQCKPQLLNFTPYSKNQIMTILTDRLSAVDDVFDCSAVQFCARKVEAVAGDMRRALDICRRAVENVEADVRTQQILSPAGDGSVSSPARRKIGVGQVSQVFNHVYSSNMMTSQQQNGSLPLQQKLAICTLLLLLKKGKTKNVSMGKLYESYNKVCRKRQCPVVDQSEFMSITTLIESRGIFGIKKSKEMRLSKVLLRLDETEVEHALQDKLLMTQVLQSSL